jgi:predicted DNA-binding protein
MITTNIRLPQEEYKEYRRIALEKGKSFAQLIREALRTYKKLQFEDREQEIRLKAAKNILRNRVRIDIPVKKLIESGRKI